MTLDQLLSFFNHGISDYNFFHELFTWGSDHFTISLIVLLKLLLYVDDNQKLPLETLNSIHRTSTWSHTRDSD